MVRLTFWLTYQAANARPFLGNPYVFFVLRNKVRATIQLPGAFETQAPEIQIEILNILP
jgi:hypothetical protein